jgi:hypothetical protein
VPFQHLLADQSFAGELEPVLIVCGYCVWPFDCTAIRAVVADIVERIAGVTELVVHNPLCWGSVMGKEKRPRWLRSPLKISRTEDTLDWPRKDHVKSRVSAN